jgi:RNA polymerase primary sigma factor
MVEKLITKSFERLLDKGKTRGFITYEELGKSLGKRGSSVENIEKAFMVILDHSVTLVEKNLNTNQIKKKNQQQTERRKKPIRAMIRLECILGRWEELSFFQEKGKLL